MLFVQGVLEVQKDACIAGQKVIIVDDLLATGGEFWFYVPLSLLVGMC